MTYKIVISDSRLFCAAALFTSSEPRCPYIHGVYIEPAEGGGVLLTATDGIKLFHVFDAEGQIAAPTSIKPEKSTLPAAWAKYGAIWIDLAAGTMSHDSAKTVMGASVVDEAFPDYRRIVPREYSGEIAQFDAAQFATFAATAKLLGGAAARVSHNGQGPALVTFPDRAHCYGVLMPLRMEPAPRMLPEMPGPAQVRG